MAEGMGQVQKAGSYHETMNRVRTDGPFDLVVLNYVMPGMPAFKGIWRIRKANGNRPVAIMSGHDTPELLDAELRAGAAGFILKRLNCRSMVAAMRLMLAGEVYTH